MRSSGWRSPPWLPAPESAATLPIVDIGTLTEGERPFDRALFLVSPGNEMDLDRVRGADGWRVLTRRQRNQGISDATIWIAFTLANDTPEPQTVVVSHDIFHLSRFTLTSTAEDGADSLRQRVLFDDPVEARPIAYAGPAGSVTVPPGGRRDVYVMLHNDFAVPLHIGIRLWSESGFTRHVVAEVAFFTFWVAALVTTAVFWLLCGVVMGGRRLVFYAAYLAATAYTYANFSGVGYQLLYPGQRWLQDLGYHWAMFLLVAASLEFARLHLDVARRHPRHDRALRLAATACFGAMLFAIIVRWPAIEAPLTFVVLTAGPAYISWLSWRAWRRDGIAHAKWMMLCWAALDITVIAGVFGTLSNVPVTEWSQMDILRVTFALSVCESALLGVSLAQWLRSVDARRIAAEAEAAHDPLTGLLNRRGFEAQMAELTAARSWPGSFWLAVFDIDHFKRINDEHSHAAGDAVLITLARTLADQRRPGEIAARHGGEEFLLVFSQPSPAAALAAVERLRHRFEAVPTAFGEALITHSFSAGLVRAADFPGADTAALVAEADARLYSAKRAGRNRVEASRPQELGAAAMSHSD